jgi:hypothetical protein
VVSCPVTRLEKEFVMNPSSQNQLVVGSGEFEETLRLIARLSAPEGLEERVQAGLRAATLTELPKARILRWPVALRLDNDWMRAAAAAAIVAVVVGGGWGISSRFQLAQPSSATAVSQRGAGQSGFSSAGAMRTPQTINGPVVVPTKAVAPETAKPAAKSPVRHGKTATAKKATAPKDAPTAK